MDLYDEIYYDGWEDYDEENVGYDDFDYGYPDECYELDSGSLSWKCQDIFWRIKLFIWDIQSWYHCNIGKCPGCKRPYFIGNHDQCIPF